MVETFVMLSALAVVVNKFIDGFVKPLFEKFHLDTFWLMYAAWLFAAPLVFLTDANLFADVMPRYPLVGQLLTALFAGGGANIINDWTRRSDVYLDVTE